MGLTLIVGNLGSGKTLLLTSLAMAELEEGKVVYATYHVHYKAHGHSVEYVDVGDLLTYFREQQTVFIPESASLMVDEGYLGTDSRQSTSAANKLMTDFVLQSRHFGLDLYFCVQLASTIDKRIRKLVNNRILAEKLFSNHYDDNGELVTQPYFKYTLVTDSGDYREMLLSFDQAKEIYPMYDTMEIVEAPMISLDKKIAQQTKKLLQKSSIEKRSKMKSTQKPSIATAKTIKDGKRKGLISNQRPT